MRFRWEIVAAAVGLLIAVGLALTDTGVGTLGTWKEPADSGSLAALVDLAPAQAPPFGVPRISADQLAEAVMSGEPGLTVVDVRPGDEAPSDRLPAAYWLPLDDDSWLPPGPFPDHRRIVLIAEDDAGAEQAWRQVAPLGYEAVAVLEGGMPAWNARYAEPPEPAPEAPLAEWEDYRARKAVSLFVAGGVAALEGGAGGAGGPRPVAAPPPLPVRQASTAPKPAEGC